MVDLTKVYQMASVHETKARDEQLRELKAKAAHQKAACEQFAKTLTEWGVDVMPDKIQYDLEYQKPFLDLHGLRVYRTGQYPNRYFVRCELSADYCDKYGETSKTFVFDEGKDVNHSAANLLNALADARLWLDALQLAEQWGFDTWDDEEYRWFKAKPATAKEPHYRVISASDPWGVEYQLEQLGNTYEVVQFSTCYGRDDDGIQRMFFTAICKRID